MNGKTIVIGVIGADVHAVGNKILEHSFAQAGFNVVNLGVMVAQEEFVAAAVETDADAIIVSSLYGHAELDAEGLRDKCIEAGLGSILLYIGGNVTVGKRQWEEVEARFTKMGFDRVYPPGTPPETDIADLFADLRIEGGYKGATTA